MTLSESLIASHHFPAPKSRYSIDHVRTGEGKVSISGWFLDSNDFETLHVLYNNRLLHTAQSGEWRQKSLDVAASTEPRYSTVRFTVEFPFPDDISLAMLQSMELSFEKKGKISRLSLPPKEEVSATALTRTPLQNIRLGIGIPTYNRSSMVLETIQRVKDLTPFNPLILVSNDGSSDNTAEVLSHIKGINVLDAPNAGIAWNKNRLLFNLHEIEKCDVVLLLEDDAQPTVYGWNVDWILACIQFGHVNFAPSWFPQGGTGNGSWHDPLHSDILTAQCSGFARQALSYVGYIDSRFGRYGHEHVEHTSRMIRMGYGGLTKADGASKTFFLLSGGLEIKDSISNFSQQHVDENAAIFQSIHHECSYRPAWRDDEQIRRLRSEMELVRRQ
ncbi:glycosyltransferase family 2 protein [Brytella acorum]|uniref:Glycosyltransferase n=1 Tax=Brytella acorum TaxID=2959299 RepID=A0AA35XWD9_9PROT|nr:glycosyltransferase [Brytella acorum]MDF3623834.1 glycosyltransferase [Brytella acorum]CAI9120750.1 glycosyltransferase [Brytella acorum]